MQEPYIDHPTEEALERFLLHHSEEQELEIVETHILACESCVSRLESLESDIAASKLALRQFQAKHAAKAVNTRLLERVVHDSEAFLGWSFSRAGAWRYSNSAFGAACSSRP